MLDNLFERPDEWPFTMTSVLWYKAWRYLYNLFTEEIHLSQVATIISNFIFLDDRPLVQVLVSKFLMAGPEESHLSARYYLISVPSTYHRH